MKRHTAMVPIHAKHSDLKISQAFNVTRSFVHKVRRELKASDGNVESVAERRKRKSRSNTVRTLQFVQQVRNIIDEDPSKSVRAISRDLQVSDYAFRRTVYEDIQHKSFVMRRGQFMYAQTREQ